MKLIIIFNEEKDIPDQVAHVNSEGMEACLKVVINHLLDRIVEQRSESDQSAADTVRINLICWNCHAANFVNPANEQFCPHCGVKAIHTLSLLPDNK